MTAGVEESNRQTLQVDLGERSYPIHIGNLGISQPAKFAELLNPMIAGQQVAVVTNETIAPLYLDKVLSALGQRQVDVYQLQDGEAYKNLASFEAITTFLLEARHNRTTCLIALGGGVVGDLCGFVAATFQRGVDFIQIPTTLLAQVDSSVGGKTAVNHPAGKNMIGAFYQPKAVVADTTVLTTLPPREYAAGLAEVVKYGVIDDVDFFHWLEEKTAVNHPAGKNMIGAFYQPKAVVADTTVLTTLPPREYAAGLAEVVKYGVIDDVDFFHWLEESVAALHSRSEEALQQVIFRSCASKAKVVIEDERESGRRAILNFGHTFGHAIEKLAGYGEWLHGEAVAIGMVMAAELSVRHCGFPQSDALRLRALLKALGLPVTLGDHRLETEAMIEAMGLDKKVNDGQLRFVLARQLGDVYVSDDVSAQALREVLDMQQW